MANLLHLETSPYLLQHANNPVHWHPWGQAAFDKAIHEQKPVLVSIGYATCHWCHVMERESFEQEHVAEYMNEHFVCIKIDREEHPDVDHFYMDALLAMNQSGGWPLNMFVTPHKEPFYGGTYYPPQKIYHRPSWMEILEAVRLTWNQKQEEIQHQSKQLMQYLVQTYQYETANGSVALDVKEIVSKVALQYDAVHGGFGTAPKFPSFNSIRLLTQIAKSSQDQQAQEMVTHSLRKLVSSGIYDAVGGGLCRYATDAEWQIPHFEKMLYDNALFISSLAQAYALQPDKRWMNTISQLTQFLQRTWQAADGLYYSAIDADSEGEEGKYYVWDWATIRPLSSFHESLAEFYDLHERGNWEEGKNILHEVKTDQEMVEKYQFLPKQWVLMKQQFLMDLWHIRQQRIPPITDTKKILAWNALLATAYFHAYKALGVEQYKLLGSELLTQIVVNYIHRDADLITHLPGGQEQSSSIYAKLDDIAYLQQALIQGRSTTKNAEWESALAWSFAYVARYFSDEKDIMFYFSDSRQTDILVRKIELLDGAILSSNAVMSENLWWYGQIHYNLDQIERSKNMTHSVVAGALRYPLSYATWLTNALRMQNEWSVVKKNLAVDSFEHTVFYQQFIDQKLLLEGDFQVDNALDREQESDGSIEIAFQECSSGYCKTLVNSVFQLF